MSLQALVNGADCGPSNALQGLSKQFERDRGVQQDLFGSGRAGSSRDTFRTQPAALSPEQAQEAARFFDERSASHGAAHAPQPFDVHALRDALASATGPATLHSPPPAAAIRSQPLAIQAPSANWATDFLSAGPSAAPVRGALRSEHQLQPQPQPFAGVSAVPQRPYIHSQFQQRVLSPPLQFAARPGPDKGKARADADLWEREFQTLVNGQQPQQRSQARETFNPEGAVDADDLSRTAGLLLDAVQGDASEKFKKSEFLGFMRQLRDRELVVDGDAVVERSQAQAQTPSAGVIGGTTIASHAHVMSEFAGAEGVGDAAWRTATAGSATPRFAAGTAAASNSTTTTHTGLTDARAATESEVRQELQGEEQSEVDRYFAQENAEYTRYWSDAAREQATAPQRSWRDPLSAQWDQLQHDWEMLEATATGIRPVSAYSFQADNPYLHGETSRAATRHHELHLPSDFQAANYASVLEKEAMVQREPRNAEAWYELGVRQQESEREHKAIQALSRAVEIEPDLLPAWMALAVSHSNEGRRDEAYNAIEEWVRRRGAPLVQPLKSEERHERLVDALIGIVRTGPADRVDADVQIALAVLFHTTEDYAKALDCFKTALAVRPEDALLYNRVGATLANSGRSEEALAYYDRALQLAPAYVRAEFNTGIAMINMGRLEDGARHLLDALALQETDGTRHDALGEPAAVTSGQMWDLLKSCVIRMNRMDLASFCDKHDLEGFRASFGPGDPMSV
ncbi:TPR-like protein [Exidia glandulosa HHB12029]|uniref:TPR-like protein n=1 Tax=Exidia glandulosa HHB12029 TaxID=1314781 RepID=A0A165E736_EXIGL|nr:TPR-like protein [Exidia glandulosa HHB12029]